MPLDVPTEKSHYEVMGLRVRVIGSLVEISQQYLLCLIFRPSNDAFQYSPDSASDAFVAIWPSA